MWRDSLIGGLMLVAGFGFQTEGLLTTGAANSGLITGLYVVLTPLLALAWNRLRGPASINPRVLIGTGIAFGGFYLLTEGFQPEVGDLLTVGAAVSFAAHIVFLSHLAHRHDLVGFTGLQLAVTSVGAFAIAAFKEGLEVPGSEVALGAAADRAGSLGRWLPAPDLGAVPGRSVDGRHRAGPGTGVRGRDGGAGDGDHVVDQGLDGSRVDPRGHLRGAPGDRRRTGSNRGSHQPPRLGATPAALLGPTLRVGHAYGM